MKRTILILCSSAALLVVSCQHKDLCYDHPHTVDVQIELDWSAAQNAAPEGMRVLFYPDGGGGPVVANLPGAHGGVVNVPTGHYNVLCFNNDTEAIRWRGESMLETIEAYTRETAIVENMPGLSDIPRAVGTEDEPMMLTADPMWRDSREITVGGRGIQMPQVVTLRPVLATPEVTYELSEVSHSENITMIRATLSGVSGSLFMGVNKLSPQPVTMPFDGAVDQSDATRIVGTFDYFGCCNDKQGKHIFTIYCWSPGGNVKASFDVTNQLHNAPDPYHVHLVINGKIEMPEDLGGGGFDPDVGSWDSQDEDLDM